MDLDCDGGHENRHVIKLHRTEHTHTTSLVAQLVKKLPAMQETWL